MPVKELERLSGLFVFREAQRSASNLCDTPGLCVLPSTSEVLSRIYAKKLSKAKTDSERAEIVKDFKRQNVEATGELKKLMAKF